MDVLSLTKMVPFGFNSTVKVSPDKPESSRHIVKTGFSIE